MQFFYFLLSLMLSIMPAGFASQNVMHAAAVANTTLVPAQYQQVIYTGALASLFSINDGVSSADSLHIQFLLGAQAQLAEMYSFPEDDMKADAYRHFFWSLRAVQQTSANAARIQTINYELAGIIARDVMHFTQQRYNDLRSDGLSSLLAQQQAQREGGAYALGRRAVILAESEDFARFQQHFRNPDIMDLWNNQIGIQAAQNHHRFVRTHRLFAQQWDNGRMIMDECDEEVTLERRQTVWENTNWWQP